MTDLPIKPNPASITSSTAKGKAGKSNLAEIVAVLGPPRSGLPSPSKRYLTGPLRATGRVVRVVWGCSRSGSTYVWCDPPISLSDKISSDRASHLETTPKSVHQLRKKKKKKVVDRTGKISNPAPVAIDRGA